MGDRANVFVTDGDRAGVYLYTHWEGDQLPLDVRLALRRERRWDDGPYLARMIFDQMTDGRHGEETGLGISASLLDNNHLIVRVDCDKQRVALVAEDNIHSATPLHEWSFTDFIVLPDDDILKAYEQ